jgi:catechol 2,3-dioxygenase-like lactoylglutathione lyase family enzyme
MALSALPFKIPGVRHVAGRVAFAEDRLSDQPRIAHVGIAVTNITEALAFYRDVLGVEPSSPDSPIAKFIARRGPGIHHICYEVADLDAALTRCREAGYRLVDEIPRSGAHGRRIAFVHPKSTAGILLELTSRP